MVRGAKCPTGYRLCGSCGGDGLGRNQPGQHNHRGRYPAGPVQGRPGTAIGNAIHDELGQFGTHCGEPGVEGYARHYMRQSGWVNIPVFACGGGARLLGVKQIFAKAWVPNFEDFTVRDLPLPEDYDSHKGAVPFDRLSVAYGLTFLGPELGGFSLPAGDRPTTHLSYAIKSFRSRGATWSLG